MDREFRPAQSRGIAILLFLTIVVLAVTTFLVLELSVNQSRFQRSIQNADALDVAQQALLGFALGHAVPGTLPCPDTTGDGFGDPAVGNCAGQLGLLPYRTLGLRSVGDSAGAVLWYAVELNYVGNAPALKNPSTNSVLNVDGRLVAFVVIAPGTALDGQQRRQLVIPDFLEGVNADVNQMNFSNLFSTFQNDQLATVSKSQFWNMVEGRVVATLADLMDDYRASCDEYPWAATFGGPYDSVSLLQAGSPALNSALPYDWGVICPSGVAPIPAAWLTDHWQDQLYYAMCTLAQGNCITVAGSLDSPAAGVVLAPGIALAGQVRPDSDPGAYFEGSNSLPPATSYELRGPLDHSATYNDVSRALAP